MSYCDVPEFYNETYPKARKEHRCCECGGTIRVGDVYAYCRGVFDGSFFSEYQHKACRDFAAEVNRTYGDGECFIPFGDVNYEIANARYWCDDPAKAGELQARWAAIRSAGRGERAA